MSLAARLTALIIFSLLPLLAVQIWGDLHQKREREAAVRRTSLAQSRIAEASVIQLTDDVRHLLAALSEVPSIRNGDHDVCSAYLSAVASQFKRYTLLGSTDQTGAISCTSAGVAKGAYTNAGRAYFTRAMEQSAFAAGDLVVGVSTHRRSIHFALPYRQQDGTRGGVILTSVDQDAVANQLASIALPPGALAMLVDASGTVIAAADDGRPLVDEWVGQPIEAGLNAMLATQTPKSIAAAGPAGKAYIFGAIPANSALAGLRVVVGLDQARTFANLSSELWRDLAGIAVGAFLAILAGVVGARRLVLAPLGSVVT